MNIFNKIKNTVKQLPRKTMLAATALTMLAAIPMAINAFAEFYPARPTFDYNKPCDPNDNDPYDRCGSLDGPVFNSFINTPSYGDERSFLDASRTDQTAAGSYKDVLPDVTEGSKEVVIRMYVHNNANKDTNDTNGIAKNTKVAIVLPTATSQVLRARGYIRADNATPVQVEDTVDFTASEEFSVSYIPGSAKLFDNDNFSNGVALSDSIVSGGALIGSDALDGNFKGCFEYEAVVHIRVKVTPKEKPNLNIEKLVRKTGDKNWVTEVSANPGDEVEWVVNTKNTGEAPMHDVTTRDVLPPHTQLVSGSVKYIDSHGTTPLADGPFFAAGNNAGLYNPGNNTLVTFKTKMLGDFEKCEVRVRNVAFAKSKEHKEIKDDADVVIKKKDCVPDEPKEPVFRCERINSIFLKDRTWRFTTDATAEDGATIKQYRYEITGPNNYDFDHVTNQANGQFDHAFPGTGTFVIMVTVDFEVDGQTKSHTSEACKTSIKISEEEEQPPVTPPKGELPVTGPGAMAGLFVSVSAAGTMAHKIIFGRRYF